MLYYKIVCAIVEPFHNIFIASIKSAFNIVFDLVE